MAYLALLSASEGRRAGFSAVLGVALGLLSIGIAAAFGVAALISKSAVIYEVLRWCGIGYMFWLAWDGWKVKGEEPNLQPDEYTLLKFFKRGFVTNILNPKAALFYVAILPGFVVVGSDSIVLQTVILSVTYVAIATCIHCIIVILADKAGKVLNSSQKSAMIGRVSSILLAGVAIWLIFSTAANVP